jgi:hypothetical protein
MEFHFRTANGKTCCRTDDPALLCDRCQIEYLMNELESRPHLMDRLEAKHMHRSATSFQSAGHAPPAISNELQNARIRAAAGVIPPKPLFIAPPPPEERLTPAERFASRRAQVANLVPPPPSVEEQNARIRALRGKQ